jgi:hypothetical protein
MDTLSMLHIQHADFIPSSVIDPFIQECERLGVPFEAHQTESEPYAGLEDYLPTAVMILLAKPFLDAFLKKAGEDGYELFKKSLVGVLSRARAINIKVFASGDKKSDPEYPFSRVFSVYSKSVSGTPVKFLFPHSLSDVDYEVAIGEMTALLEDMAMIPHGRRMGSLILLEFSIDTMKWIERGAITQEG